MQVGEAFKIYTNSKKDTKKMCADFEDFFIKNIFEDEEAADEYRNLFSIEKDDGLYLGEFESGDFPIFEGDDLPRSNVEAYFAFLVDFISNNSKTLFETKHILSYRGNGTKEVYSYKYTGDSLIYKVMGGERATFYDEEETKNAGNIIDGIINPEILSEKIYDVENGVINLDSKDKPQVNVNFSW